MGGSLGNEFGRMVKLCVNGICSVLLEDTLFDSKGALLLMEKILINGTEWIFILGKRLGWNLSCEKHNSIGL